MEVRAWLGAGYLSVHLGTVGEGIVYGSRGEGKSGHCMYASSLTPQECTGKRSELQERERRLRVELAEMEKQKKKCGRDLEVRVGFCHEWV